MAELPRQLRRQLTFLIDRGAHTIPHGSSSLLMHLVATRNVLVAWDAQASLATAGLYHSIYGSPRWSSPLVAIDQRAAVRAVIGARAEAAVALYAVLDLYDCTAAQLTGGDALRSTVDGSVVDPPAPMRSALLALAAANLVAAFPIANPFKAQRAVRYLHESVRFLPPAARTGVRRLLRRTGCGMPTC